MLRQQSFFLLSMLLCVKCLHVKNLRGSWILTDSKKGYNLKATVPGGVYIDLTQNNIINDVFYGYNDAKTRWVSKNNWIYTKTFLVEKELVSHSNIILVFEGIDTFSKVFFNNVLIGNTANMFVRYEFNLKPHILLGNNTLRVEFQSPVYTARELFKKQLENYLVPPMCVPPKYNGECHVNHIRKMQASFGWDWGPAFPSMGIWKKVYIEAYNSTVLSDMTVSVTSHDVENNWNISLKIYLKNHSDLFLQGEIRIYMQTDIVNVTEIHKINIRRNADGEYVFVTSLTIPKYHVHMWWPNGMGKATLYELKAKYISPNKKELSEKVRKIGFRTVELVQHDLEKGRSFYFKINNIPIFIKGSNIIPLSILPELGYNSTYIKYILQSVKDVHMNMLRVWGGGVYESDEFYKTADEMGILIWQDFMFACSMYPTTEEFLKNVSVEIQQQVKRLQYHPSIAIWAANNENEVALRQNWYGTSTNFTIYETDYKILYVDTIKTKVLSIDNTRPFLTSSPTNGIQSETEGYVAKDPQSHFHGDVHFYNYLMDGWTQNIYPIARFASEYGYQSLPSVATLLTATNNTEDLQIFDDFLKHRQHRDFGYLEMEILISYQLKLPDIDSPNFYKAFIFYSQIVQAVSVKIETERYRRWRSNSNDIGEGSTMGALYWQLNDVWVAPSWSSIDFKGNWKMLHYYAKDFFAPVIVTTDVNVLNDMDVYVVSDLVKPINDAFLIVYVYKWNSVVPLDTITLKINVLPGMSTKVVTYSLTTLFSKVCQENVFENCFVYFKLEDSNHNKIGPSNYLLPLALKKSKLSKPNLQVVNVAQVDGSGKLFDVKISTDVVSLFVWVEVDGIKGRFSENGFLQVTDSKIIQFFSQTSISLTELRRRLSVTHLLDKEFL